MLINRFKPECRKPNSFFKKWYFDRYCMHVTYFRSFPREQMRVRTGLSPDLLPIADARIGHRVAEKQTSKRKAKSNADARRATDSDTALVTDTN